MPSRVLGRLGLIAALLTTAGYAVVHRTSAIDAPIHSDGYSYYVYVPSWFLHHDPSLQAVADDCCGGVFPEFTSITRWPETNRWVNPHPIGVALLMTPPFLAAHLLTLWSNLPPDGFSLYYQHAAGLSGSAAFVVGLLFLRSLLSRYVAAGVTLASLATMAFATNLFHYATFDSTFSHAFSFALVAALLDLTDRWWRQPTTGLSAALAVVSALIVLVRHTNIVFVSILPLWQPRAVSGRWRSLLGIAALAAFCVTPQLVVYKLATGSWLVSPYERLGRFSFDAPFLWPVLFGVTKGLFFWSPALLMAAAGGFVDHPLARHVRAAAALTFAATAYLIASWSDWQFGASFGHRGFTDGLAIAAVLLAAFFDRIRQKPPIAVPVAALTIALTLLSSGQMVQYWMGILPSADTTWTQYRERFLRFR